MIVKALSNPELLLARQIIDEEIAKFLTKGDVAGHGFHGNQWTGGEGGIAQSKGMPNSGVGSNPFENYQTIQDQIVARGYPHFSRDGSLGMRGWIFPDGSFTDLGGDTHAGFLRQFAPTMKSGAFLPSMAQNAGWIRKEDSEDYSFSHPSTDALNALESHLTNGGFPYSKLIHFEITNRDGSLNRDISITKSEFEDHNFDLRSTINDAKRYDLRYTAAADPDLVKGDILGHDFHGNQWVGGEGGSVEASLAGQLRNTNGFTYPEPKSGYVVSEEPEKTVIIPGYATDKDIHDYMEKNPGTVGGWYHDGKTYLDSVRVYHDRTRAIEAGKKANQLAIWDVIAQKEIQLIEEAVAGMSDLTIHAGLEAGQAFAQQLNQQQHAANPDLVKGDAAGHDFHGNQYTGSLGAGQGEGSGYAVDGMTPKQQETATKWMETSPHLKTLQLGPQSTTTFRQKFDDVYQRSDGTGKFWYQEANGSDPNHQPTGSLVRPDGTAIPASCKGIADANGVDMRTAAGVVAATSPQTEWQHDYVDGDRPSSFPNLAQADRIIAFCKDPERQVEISSDDIAKLGKTPATSKLDVKPGTYALKDLNPAVIAVVTPGLRGPSGTYCAADAVRIARGEDPDKVLGSPKVRTFFNNLYQPDADDGATIDGRMLMGATKVTTSDAEGKALANFFKGGGTFGTAVYRHLNDAVRANAHEAGLLPSQYQAIVWKQLEKESVGTVYARGSYAQAA